MKRIIFLLAIIGTIFVGCNPIEDIYEDLDAIETPIAGTAEYTLTSEDYDDLDLGFGSFSSEDDAKAMLPPFLSDLYPTWGEGSAVIVGYELFIGGADGVSDFTGAGTYELTVADYAATGSDALGFYPNVDAEDEIPAVLDAAIAGPSEGDLILAEYEQYFEDPEIGVATPYGALFPPDYDSFENIDVLGAEGWFSGSSYAGATGFDGAPQDNEDWFISPEIDLSGEAGLLFQISQRISFLNGAPHEDHVNILVSTDYTTGGDHTAATWDVITLSTIPSGDTSDFITSEQYDFSAYDDSVIHIAFKFETTTMNAPLWRIEWFNITNIGISGDTNDKGTYFVYDDGEWETADDVYYLSKADYDSMGEGSGQPGRFNNFSSSTPADSYIPTFLSLNEPFAFGQEEDRLIVVYKYFSSSCGCIQTRGNAYTVIGGDWTAHDSVISTTLQFGHDGNTWVPDNTIRYSFTGNDVSLISNHFISIYPGPADNVGFFGSFDRRISSPNFWSEDMLLEAFNVLLDTRDPSAQEGQKYVLTYVIYNGTTTDETMSVIKTGGVWVYQE